MFSFRGDCGRRGVARYAPTRPYRCATAPSVFGGERLVHDPLLLGGTSTIPFELPETAEVRVSVYDLLGREVAALLEGRREAGRYRARFDANGLAAGVYVVRAVMTAEAGGATRAFSQKLTVLR
jgi:hypothetical protein